MKKEPVNRTDRMSKLERIINERPFTCFLFGVAKTAALGAFIAIALLGVSAKAHDPLPEITIKLELDAAKISGGEKSKAKLSLVRNGNTQPLTFRLESSNQELVKFTLSEITFRPDQTTAGLEFSSAAAPIKSAVTLRALLQPADQLISEQTIEIVPARLNRITLSSNSMFGIENAKITCTVELKAPAPAGGIELYLSRLVVAGLTEKNLHLDIPNPRVDSGKLSASFAIEYEDIESIHGEIDDFRSATNYNQASRSNDLYIGLELGSDGLARTTVVPGFVQKATFTVTPLKVNAISVQPASISGGSEAVATFTLNAAPLGANEVAFISPRTVSYPGKTFARLLGSSCSSSVSSLELIELPLSQGVTTYSFKVCSVTVSTSTPSNVTVMLRSGFYSAPVTVNQ